MFNFLALGYSLICYMSASLFSSPSSWNSICQHISVPIWPTISFPIVTCLKEEEWEKKYVCFTELEFYIPRRPFNAYSTVFLKKGRYRNEEPKTKGNLLPLTLAHGIIWGPFPLPLSSPTLQKMPSLFVKWNMILAFYLEFGVVFVLFWNLF